MPSSSDINYITYLDNLSFHLNNYLSIVILIFGTVGNLLNCLALSQRTLRTNPCAFLFLTSSIASIITLMSGVTVRLLAGWSADLTDRIGWLCKFRIFILFSSRTIASWLIVLATFDRWVSSSTNIHRRQMSSLKNAQRGIIIIICLSSLVYAQIFYCYEANLTNAPLKCYGKTIWCRLLIDLEFIFISILIPSLLMFLFSFMTILNVRQLVLRRIQLAPSSIKIQTATMKKHTQRLKKAEYYLLLMLFVQVILFILFSSPQAIQSLYTNITRFQVKSPLENATNNFLFNLFLLLTYVTNGMPFYIYTLTGGIIFRKALFHSIRDFIRTITCRRR
ncbi:unnamed protein product [Rotaria sp. Silwood2]|nr:unnamed protein product [Rotaria sp. Silwood2]CAF2935897.1 unnamed protein product [Rotaria sp. Silwood2]CAF3113884.1 unnamed protein product [Rotaria sp. Silwood2]CAF3441311.1 unnamed protein product [Rotaria sp. Silwood2]CAF4056052.1 unnamed protein product [Rotaria sp. Silwood2]